MTRFIEAHAKINLYLDILATTDDLHEMSMVNQSVSLADELEFNHRTKKEIKMICDDPDLVQDNLIHKAFALLLEKFPEKVTHGFEVRLNKRIPSGAGLGGGSADAATAMRFFLETFGIEISRGPLMSLLLKLGSDIPYCYWGGCQRVQGVGDRLEPWSSNLSHFLIVNPGIHISTRDAFAWWDQSGEGLKPRSSLPVEEDFHTPYNAFESVIFPRFPQLVEIKQVLISEGADHAWMTGSGSTMIGSFASAQGAVQAGAAFSMYSNVWSVKSV